MTTHLVIPDPHANPAHHNKRFDYLGKFIMDERPDIIVCLGDMADMPSLCTYEQGKKAHEGQRYQEDLKHTHDAVRRLLKPMKNHNRIQAEVKKKGYKPRLVMLLGNHENRIDRAVESQAILEGTMSTADLGYEKFGWEVVPFLDIIEIDRIAYSHYFASGVMARPISGENPARAHINKMHVSCTAGHSHLRDFSCAVNAFGETINCLVAGCYVEAHHDYAGPANKLWWRGIVMKRNVCNGDYDPEFISLKSLKEKYS
jgi:hypothetical protein